MEDIFSKFGINNVSYINKDNIWKRDKVIKQFIDDENIKIMFTSEDDYKKLSNYAIIKNDLVYL